MFRDERTTLIHRLHADTSSSRRPLSDPLEKTLEAGLFAAIAGYCGAQRGGPLGEDVLLLTDDNGDRHRFYFETFFNRYDALTLGKYLRPVHRVMSVSA